MRSLKVFENVTLDGYFVDGSGGMDWAHRSDPEWIEWTINIPAEREDFLSIP